MATLYIRQYTRLAHDENGHAIAAGLEPGKDTSVAIGGVTASVAINGGTKFVRLHCDAICNFTMSVGASTATTAMARMAANQTEFFGIAPGVDTLSVIAGS